MHIGLIAGNGSFPLLVLEAARSLGHEVTVVAVNEEAGPELERAVARHTDTSLHWLSLGQLGRCIEILCAAGVRRVVMAGQVKHVSIFSGVVPDRTLLRVLLRVRSKNTDALIAGVAAELSSHGLELMDSTVFLQPLLAPPGVLTVRAPTDDEKADLHFGYPLADAIAGLDIGQSIAVKDRAVVAVEGMEGTDLMIARAGQLAGKGSRIVKVAKPNQDMRFDVPVVGARTIEAMRQAGCTALSIDAGRTLVFDRAELVAAAESHGITVVGRER
jgi:UDP-2,3-diacylglucosamine hydrolase